MTDLERAIYDAGKAVGRAESMAAAAEMRERAARLADGYCTDRTDDVARGIRSLPLTPEEPIRERYKDRLKPFGPEHVPEEPARRPVAPSTDPDVSVSGRLIVAHPITPEEPPT